MSHQTSTRPPSTMGGPPASLSNRSLLSWHYWPLVITRAPHISCRLLNIDDLDFFLKVVTSYSD